MARVVNMVYCLVILYSNVVPVEESESERAFAQRQAELTQNLVTYRAGPAQNPDVQSRSFKVIQQKLAD